MIVGALGSRGRALVDDRGAITPVGSRVVVDWWIGADDRWRLPAREPSTRQRTIGAAPVPETAVRVPGGAARQRVYGVGGPAGLVVIEVENASPLPVVVGFVLRGAHRVGAREERVLRLGGRVSMLVPFAAPRWAISARGDPPIEDLVLGGRASGGPLPVRGARRGRSDVALLYPLSHRNRLRLALALGEMEPAELDLAALPDADRAARGWATLLDGRGLRTALPDPSEQAAVDLARTQVLLDPVPDALVVAALEGWGFDSEAAVAWRRLPLRARRRAARRDLPARPDTPAGRLLATRSRLVAHDGHSTISVLPDPAPSWSGRDLEVHDAPTRIGRVSYALRWHGSRPALLWEMTDAAAGTRLRADALDPGWSTTQPVGEALLGGAVRRA